MKKIFFFVCAFFIFLISCSKEPIEVTVEMEVGGVYQFDNSYTFDYQSNDLFSLEDFTFKALKEGEVKITCFKDKETYNYILKIKPRTIVTQIELEVGESYVFESEEAVLTTNSNIVEVQELTIIALSEGQTTIELTLDDITYLIEVTIELKKYTLNYRIFNESYSLTFTDYTKINLPTPSKEGYIFIGWFENEVQINSFENRNYELTAVFEEIKTLINFNLNGGTFNAMYLDLFVRDDILIEELTVELDTQVKANYTYLKKTNEGIYVISSETDFDYSLELKDYPNQVYFEIIENTLKVYQVNYSFELFLDTLDELISPSKSRNTFKGWFLEDGTEITDLSEIKGLEEVNLFAKWEYRGGDPIQAINDIGNAYGLLFSKEINSEIIFPSIDSYSAAQLEFISSEPNIFSSNVLNREIGKLYKITMTLHVTLNEYSETFIYEVKLARVYKDLASGGIIGGYNYTGNYPSDATLNNIDILYCAFGSAAKNGRISNLTSLTNTVKNYMERAQSKGVYVILCVNTTELATVAASSELIKIFVDDVLKALESGFDGIDIDWESPTPATKTNYTNLMKELYTRVKAVNKRYLVTSALGGGPWHYVNFDLLYSQHYMDYINLMTYDLHAAGKSTHHNALYKSTQGNTLGSCTIDETLPFYNNLGIPNEKILIGIPFYAREFKDTDGLGKLNVGSATSKTFSYIYQNYLTKQTEGVIVGFDEECKVPYVYDGNARIFYSFDNEVSIEIKAHYVSDKNLAGMMYWVDNQDYQNKLSSAMASHKELMKFKK